MPPGSVLASSITDEETPRGPREGVEGLGSKARPKLGRNGPFESPRWPGSGRTLSSPSWAGFEVSSPQLVWACSLLQTRSN